MLFAIVTIPFFLLSHTKKERVRALVPFRLSDTQAIVFLISILITMLVNIIIMNNLYSIQIVANGSSLAIGFKLALSALLIMLMATYSFSRSIKIANTEICYLDHQMEDELQKYNGILKGEKEKKNNMSLPI